MDNAVALVETYLRLNGFFTVTEFPVVEAGRDGYRTATDLDVLAFRFPHAGRLASIGPKSSRDRVRSPDPILGCSSDQADMIVGEVKEGRAELNASATDALVLRAAFLRFGCCDPSAIHAQVETLLRKGVVITPHRHRVRLVAFGSAPPAKAGNFAVISLGHVLEFLRGYVRENWEALRQAQFKDAAFAFLVMEEKARRGAPNVAHDGRH